LYALNSFHLALPIITINALELLPLEFYLQPVEEYKPYDHRLHDAVTALYQKTKKRTLQLTAMRREKPAILRQAFKEELAAEERKGESLRRGWEELGVVQRAAEGGGTDEGTGVEGTGGA